MIWQFENIWIDLATVRRVSQSSNIHVYYEFNKVGGMSEIIGEEKVRSFMEAWRAYVEHINKERG